MRGCGAGRNISRARSSRSIDSALCDYFSRHAPHTPLLLDTFFPFVGTQTATVSTPPSHAMAGGSLVVVKATASTSADLESPTVVMWPPHAPNPTYLGCLIHFTNPHTPNNDEHELHRRLRSQKASNRSFLRRHGNGREGLSHFGNAPHMHTCTHAHTQHTQTQTHGNWRCWRRPDSIVSKLGLDIPLKGGKGHSRWTSDRIFSCFWRSLYGRMSLGGMGPDGSRSWRAVYRRNSILCNNFKPECEDSEDDARASRLPSWRPNSLVTLAPVVCYSRVPQPRE